jgi:hypothetical protein
LEKPILPEEGVYVPLEVMDFVSVAWLTLTVTLEKPILPLDGV